MENDNFLDHITKTDMKQMEKMAENHGVRGFEGLFFTVIHADEYYAWKEYGLTPLMRERQPENDFYGLAKNLDILKRDLPKSGSNPTAKPEKWLIITIVGEMVNMIANYAKVPELLMFIEGITDFMPIGKEYLLACVTIQNEEITEWKPADIWEAEREKADFDILHAQVPWSLAEYLKTQNISKGAQETVFDQRGTTCRELTKRYGKTLGTHHYFRYTKIPYFLGVNNQLLTESGFIVNEKPTHNLLMVLCNLECHTDVGLPGHNRFSFSIDEVIKQAVLNENLFFGRAPWSCREFFEAVKNLKRSNLPSDNGCPEIAPCMREHHVIMKYFKNRYGNLVGEHNALRYLRVLEFLYKYSERLEKDGIVKEGDGTGERPTPLTNALCEMVYECDNSNPEEPEHLTFDYDKVVKKVKENN